MPGAPDHLILDPLRIPAFVDRLRETDVALSRSGFAPDAPDRLVLQRALDTAACQPAYIHTADAPLVSAVLRRRGRLSRIPLLETRLLRQRRR